MKNALLFVGVTCFLYFAQAQDTGRNGLHELIQRETARRISRESSPKLSELVKRLQVHLPPEEQTDVLFEISRVYMNQLKVDSALYFAERIKSLGYTTEYKQALGVYQLLRGLAFFLRNNRQECIDNLEKATATFVQYKMPRYEGQCYFQLARMYSLNFENDSLIKSNFWKALPLVAIYGTDKEFHQALHHFGLALFFICELDSASYYQTAALRMAENSGNKVMIFEDASDLGDIFLASGDLRAAIKYLKYSIDNYEIPGNRIGFRSTLFNYAECLILTNQYDQAESTLAEARKISAEFHDEAGPLNEKKLRGLLSYQKGNYGLAASLLREAYSAQDQITDFEFEVKDIAIYLGRAELKTGELNNAVQHLRRARNLSNKFQFYTDEIQSDSLLSEAFQSKGNVDSAYYYFRSSAILKDSINTVEKQRAITEITTRYEVEKKEQQIISLKRDEKNQRNLAMVIIGSVILLGLFGFYRYRQNKKLSTQLSMSLLELKQAQDQLIKTEKEKEAENLRSHISRDIHDEIASTLSGVALLSEIAKQKLQKKQDIDAGKYLEHITLNSKEMVEKMSDIIWTINPRNDSFERILFKLQSYALGLCAGKGILFHHTIDDSLMEILLPMQDRKNIYMLVKEAINNAVKYSEAANIDFSIRKEINVIQVEIKDDGKGFIPREHVGNGIYNMQARAKELNGSLQISSEEGKGTTVRLQFNFHPIEVQP